MKTLIAALLGINVLLIALVTAQSVQSNPVTYDQVKTIQYEKCLDFEISQTQKRIGVIKYSTILNACLVHKP